MFVFDHLYFYPQKKLRRCEHWGGGQRGVVSQQKVDEVQEGGDEGSCTGTGRAWAVLFGKVGNNQMVLNPMRGKKYQRLDEMGE